MGAGVSEGEDSTLTAVLSLPYCARSSPPNVSDSMALMSKADGLADK